MLDKVQSIKSGLAFSTPADGAQLQVLGARRQVSRARCDGRPEH